MKNTFWKWIKGDSFGIVEEIKETVNIDGEEYHVFNSGRRIRTDMLDQFLIESNKDEPDNQFRQNAFQMNPVETDSLKKESNDLTHLKKVLANPKLVQPKTLDFKINVKLPTYQTYEVLLSLDDNSEKILSNLIETILNDSLENFKESVEKYIKEFYNIEVYNA